MILILLIAVIVLAILLVKTKNQFKQQQTEGNTLQQQLKQKQDEAVELQRKVKELEYLRKFEVVQNAESEAQRVLIEADARAAVLIKEATDQVNAANQAARDIKSEASAAAKANREKAEEQLKAATIQAGVIIDNAHKQAQEIAGDAYKAIQNADHLEKTIKALQNIVDGYGDAYLIPSYSLLDELADEFGHTEAGTELKKARERTRHMLQNGTAAKCEYVEYVRKKTAVNFVADAFNGKVDTILASAKHDNYGTLEQKIKDAFYLVNELGKPFKEARITKEYLQVRLEELRWAVIANELKLKEREEQRAIKEQIREEEKARREYEKAMREAEKEEEMLRKAIEKAQKEVNQASEEQKAKYEEKLRELNEKLQAAEEKNQRALSMAQQTRTGHVYIISNIGSFGEDVYKIGMTRRLEPLDRVKELGDASVPFEFDVHSLILSEDAPALEKELHKRFLQMQMNKVNPRKEFFKVSLADIRREIEAMGIEARWTMAAEAREYKETLAIEKSILENPSVQQQWLKHQLEAAEAVEFEEEAES
jgi:Tfp pilus assembly protein PilV